MATKLATFRKHLLRLALQLSPRARGFGIPPNALRINLKKHPEIEIYVWTTARGRPASIGFWGKGKKPIWYNTYTSEASREKSILEHIQSYETSKEFKAQRLQQRREKSNLAAHGIEVGTILYSSWGYDQTNVNFYMVTKILGSSTVELEEIGKTFVSEERGVSYVTADKSWRSRKPMKRRISADGSFRIGSSYSASKWDGKPKYQTSAYAGH